LIQSAYSQDPKNPQYTRDAEDAFLAKPGEYAMADIFKYGIPFEGVILSPRWMAERVFFPLWEKALP